MDTFYETLSYQKLVNKKLATDTNHVPKTEAVQGITSHPFLHKGLRISLGEYIISKETDLTFFIIIFNLITVFSLLNALGVYIFFLILGWASIGEGR